MGGRLLTSRMWLRVRKVLTLQAACSSTRSADYLRRKQYGVPPQQTRPLCHLSDSVISYQKKARRMGSLKHMIDTINYG